MITSACYPICPYSTQINFKAVVDTLIPSSIMAYQSGWTFQYGGVDLCTWEYLMMSFDSLPTPLANKTSHLLDVAAFFIYKEYGHSSFSPCEGLFSTLSRKDRFVALDYLLNLQIPPGMLPVPYRNDPVLIQITVDSIYQLTYFGYYSEWYGYGETRCNPPSFRHLCTYPISWSYTGYPGPSFGYRDFRGYLLNMQNLKSE
ncbi:hypothetical protein [Halobacillus hunanensis]|uniref:hypothetical protein n=1 Tax=Halobacillus hunanensis TaxID=578214 RepID=UPI0011178BF4|nr:hypothetical protein [Halobacillus hunanensis]